MPNSSRRKQSKPQHLRSEEEEGSTRNEINQPVTSSCPSSGVKNTQEDIYGSMDIQENGDSNRDEAVPETNYDTSKTDCQDLKTEMTNIKEKENSPHDLSVKTKVAKNDLENDFDMEEEMDGADEFVSLYSPPSAQLSDRFCVYCNTVKKSPADLQRHLRKHTGDTPFHCDECTKQFKSKRSLQYHQFMNHGKQPDDGKLAHRYQLLQKLHEQESPSKSPCSAEDTGAGSNHMETGSMMMESLNKRRRIDDLLPQQSSYNSAITPASTEMGFDLRIPKTTGDSKQISSENMSDGQDLSRSCPVCSKVFPKPSDLKRHMMCHTGEKPFRCEFCNKPFRAKSSMNYHLKAAHGMNIELSPGLEERYLRMKTRTSIGYLQKGNLNEGSLIQLDNHTDIDEIEEDTEESVDSSLFCNMGIGSEVTDSRSQGQFGNTGNEEKSALDLSVPSRSKELLSDVLSGQVGNSNIIQIESPFKKSRISIHNETVLVTRLDGLDILNGQSSSIYKCYLCGKMFHRMSKLQCHLSLHFDKQVVTYECCFCEEIYQFKAQLSNHIRRRHSKELSKSKGKNDDGEESTSNVHSDGHIQSGNQYSCRYCQKVFNKLISLNKHMRLHFWNRNCFCRICGKSFNRYTSLQLHMSRFHWKTIGKSSNLSALRQKVNFFNTYRFKPESHDGILNSINDEPLDLIKNKSYSGNRQVNGNTTVLSKSPIGNGDQSDAGTSHHSSENIWSGYMSSEMYKNEEGVEIKSLPKRSLMPFLKREMSPRHKSPRKSTPNHLKNQTQLTSDNHLPLNFIKSESTHQDSNNNESVLHNAHQTSESKTISSGTEPLMSGYNMNATSHLLMAKALAAHQTLSHFTNTSQPMIFPPNHLPPSLTGMTQMMTLPVSVPPLNNEAVTNTSQSPSPASHTSSKSDTSPEDRELYKETNMRDSLVGYPRVQWSQGKSDNWTFNMYSPADTGHTDGRKVSSLSRTQSRLGIVHTPINREAVCKATTLTDGRTVYKCPFCSKEFVSFSDINRHMDFHEDIRPYKCQFCDYYARTNSQLKVHMMRHQGIREYCCKLCNYKGVTQSDLNRHMKSQIHMLKARNACTYCGEGFVTSKNLEKHLDGNCIVKMQKLNGGLDLPLQESIA